MYKSWEFLRSPTNLYPRKLQFNYIFLKWCCILVYIPEMKLKNTQICTNRFRNIEKHKKNISFTHGFWIKI